MPVIEENHYTKAEELLPELTEKYVQGVSTNKLAQEYGIRREAISTVLMVAGIAPSTPGRQLVLDYVDEHPGLSVDDLAEALEMPKSTVSRYLRGTPQQRKVITRKKTDYTTYSDDVKIACLREAWDMLDDLQRSKGLSRARYDKLVGKFEDKPSSVTFIRRWSSWSEACAAAGIEASAPRRSSYEREFSNDDVVAGVAQFVEETGKTAFHEYAKWAQTSGRASGPLVIIRLGSWSRARSLAMGVEEQEPVSA